MNARLLLGLGVGALFILGSLYLLLLPDIRPTRETEFDATTESLRAACYLFEGTYQRPPRDLNELVERAFLSESVLVDPWRRPYLLQQSGNRWRVLSLGPDGKLGTKDDKETTVEFSVAGTSPLPTQGAYRP